MWCGVVVGGGWVFGMCCLWDCRVGFWLVVCILLLFVVV